MPTPQGVVTSKQPPCGRLMDRNIFAELVVFVNPFPTGLRVNNECAPGFFPSREMFYLKTEYTAEVLARGSKTSINSIRFKDDNF